MALKFPSKTGISGSSALGGVSLDSANRLEGSRLFVIELCGGILPATMAAQSLGINVEVVYFSEVDDDAVTVARTVFPGALELVDISGTSPTQVVATVDEHTDAEFGIFGGPPRTDVVV